MSEAIDIRFQKALQYAIADICDESRRNNLTLADTVELAIMRGMKWQDNIDHINKWSGYHSSEELHHYEDGTPYLGI